MMSTGLTDDHALVQVILFSTSNHNSLNGGTHCKENCCLSDRTIKSVGNSCCPSHGYWLELISLSGTCVGILE